ncbi:MAG TPA: phosphomannomutase/phosphoglucomutase [Pseudomonadales bacterium]|nr:phosphomannomutase/phosphoglucomutase [Pseudomonadales bacterium]
MAKDTPDDTSEPLSVPDRAPTSGPLTEGLWSYPLLAIGIALGGVVAATLLVWSTIVRPANTNHRLQTQAIQAQSYANFFNARLAALQRELSDAASAKDTIDALATYDPATITAQNQRLTHLISTAERVDVIPKGKAEVDLSANVPISFAALDVIKRAETQEYVGPEASQVNQRPVFYAARPITDAGTVTGVLFAAMSMDFFFEPLKILPSDLGQVTVEQQFESAAARSVLQYGNEPDSNAAPVRIKLNAPTWTLVFKPSQSATPDIVNLAWIWTPLLVVIALILGGVYLSYSRLFRTLERDSATLIDHVTRIGRGREGNVARYNLAMFQQIAVAATRSAKRVPPEKDEPRPAPVRKAAAPKAVTPKRKPGAKAIPPPEPAIEPEVVDDDDFLDVRSPDASEGNLGIEVSEDVSPLDSGLKLDPLIFRAYDIRGIVSTNLTEDVVYWIGRAFAADAKQNKMSRAVVGCDGRLSSPKLKKSLARGMTEGGIDVTDIGEVPTPLLYYATHALDTGTGVMITGSHNPPEYNGLKMMIAGETLAEERIQHLRERIEGNKLSSGDGAYDEMAIVDHYLDRVLNDVAVAQPMKVVVDCGNGVAGGVVPRLIAELGCEVVPLYCEVDGNFPNHHPDPADPKNLEDLITVVKAEKADLGLAFDGDGDRLGVVTERGTIIWPDKLLMLFARDIVGRNPGADIIFDVKCSRHLNSLISEYGGRPIMWKTGHSHMKAKLKETGALLAGEFSGHICFGERWYGFDDALYSAARLLEIVGAESKSVSKLFEEFPVTFTTPEIKVNTTESAKFSVMERLSKEGKFGDGTITTIDGIRVDYPDGWGLVRPSNTSPVLTLRFEADGQNALDRIQKVFRDQLKKIDPKLVF